MFAVRTTGELKLLAAAGCTSIWTSHASGSLTFIVIVAGIVSEFLRNQSVHLPTTITPSLVATNVSVRALGVPPSPATGGASGTTLTAAEPAPGPERSVEGATGLREQLVSVTARVVITTAERRLPCRMVCLAGESSGWVPRCPGPSPFDKGKPSAATAHEMATHIARNGSRAGPFKR